MNFSLHCLYWDNGRTLAESHKKVLSHFNIPITYYHENGVRHGEWMNRVINESNDDVVGFLDNDCVPTNDSIVKEAVSFAYNNNSFLGTAQVCNHIHPCTHIYASPAFFFIAKSCYKKMGSPSFLENEKCDVAEGVSYQAENQSIAYRVLYPTHFERSSHEGRWRLSNYGSFGIGTTFSGGVYHLHQGRYGMYNDIFIRRCSEIVTGVFSTNGMLSATAF